MSDLSDLEELRRKLLEAQDRLRHCLDYIYNPFEPDNQSQEYKNLKKFIKENE